MNTQDRVAMINDLTIEIVKAQVKAKQVQEYLANGGDPKDLQEQHKSPEDGNIPF